MTRLKGAEDGQQNLDISLVQPGTTPDPNFACTNSEFNEYYRVTCYSDMKAGLNRT